MKLDEKKRINRGISLVLCFFMVWFSAVPAGAEGFFSVSVYDEDRNSAAYVEGKSTTGSSITGSGIMVLLSDSTLFQGNGTESSPYIISSEEDLKNLASEVNNDSKKYEEKYFEIKKGRNIVLKEQWTPIGTEENPFLGNFNGNSQIIENVSITSPSAVKYQGLFGYSKGTIRNLNVTGKIDTDSDYVGGIAGYTEGEILNCTYGPDGKSFVKGGNYVGGIAGYSDVKQFSLKSSHDVLSNNGNVEGKNHVGGIYGYIQWSEEAAYIELTNTGNIEGTENVGGIIGFAKGTTALSDSSRLTNKGNITAFFSAGGILGSSSKATGDMLMLINGAEAINEGTINSHAYPAGGIAGYVHGLSIQTNSKAVNMGKITSGSDAGGIVGLSYNSISMNNLSEAINNGVVETVGDNAGGISGSSAGINLSSNASARNEGKITSKGSNAGGISGSGGGLSLGVGTKITNEGEITAAESNAGGIFGRGFSAAWNTLIKGEIINKGNIKSEGSNGGGIMGLAPSVTFGLNSSIINEGRVEALSDAGGLIGNLSSTLIVEDGAEVVNKGIISSEENNAGGVAGFAVSSYFRLNSKVKNEQTIEAGLENAGGIIGSAVRIIVTGNTEVVNEGKVTAHSNAGGIAGLYKGNIGTSTGFVINSGDVEARNLNAGGIVGKIEGSDDSSLTVTKVGVSGGRVSAGENTGGIIGYVQGKAEIYDSYNKAVVSDAGAAFGSIAGGSSAGDISITDSFSYIKDGGEITEIPLTNIATAKINKSYFLVKDEFDTQSNVTAKKAEEFNYGKLSYILDTDKAGKRKALWGQKLGTDESPVHYHADNQHPMVYKNELRKNNELTDITVEFDISPDSHYKIYDNYTYLNGASEVKLKVVGLKSSQLLVFSPPGFVSLIRGEYTLTGNEKDVVLSYNTGVRIEADTDWYKPDEALFEIGTEAQLIGLSDLVIGDSIDFEGKTIVLTQDISMTSSVWNPIGSKQSPFRGNFEAKKKSSDDSDYASINNFKYTSGDMNFGLFGYVENASFKNLRVNGSITGAGNIAGIAADSKSSRFISCINDSAIISTAVVGGITAVSEDSYYEDCINLAYIYSSAVSGKAGGISGVESEGIFEGCRNAGYVQSAGSAGGIASEIKREGILRNCLNEGTVEGNGYTGGIVGNTSVVSTEKIRIIECYNAANGTVMGSGTYAGGVIGMAGGVTVIRNCFNDGMVDSRAVNAGGVAGSLYSGATVEGCYNSENGTVKNKGDYTAGVFGTIGIYTKLDGIFNAGRVIGDGDYTAGVFGYGAAGMYDNVKRCYNIGDVEGNGLSAAGICTKLEGEKKYSSDQTSYLTECYNTGRITGTGNNTMAAGITGTNFINLSGSICSYVVDCYNLGKISTIDPFNMGAITAAVWQGNENSYYSVDSVDLQEGMRILDYGYVTALDKSAFENGKAAYLLDKGGTAARKKIWGQGDGYPISGARRDQIVYKAAIAASGPAEGFEGEAGAVNRISYMSSEVSKDSVMEIYTPVEAEVHILYNEKEGYLLNTVSSDNKKADISIDEETKLIKFKLNEEQDLKINVNFIKIPDGLKEKYTVTFDSNRGKWQEGERQLQQEVKGLTRVKMPVSPVNETLPEVKQKLTGWYTDAECKVPYDFTAVVISDMILYAGWEEVLQHSVILDANGGDFGDGNEIKAIMVDDGETAPLQTPAKKGYDFRGWYTDEECLYIYDTEMKVTSGLTLYAGWVQEGHCVVIFDGNGGVVKDGDEYFKTVAVTITKGKRITSLTAKREDEGSSTFSFDGWYAANESKWDFYDEVNKNMVLKAHWKENFFDVPGVYTIGSLDALEKFRDMVNEGSTYLDSVFILTADIKLPSSWTPIGFNKSPSSATWDDGFRGTFEGGGHTITLDNNQKSPVFGVLGYQGAIRDLKIQGGHVYNIPVPFVSSSHGEISNIEVSGEFYRCVSGLVLEAYTGVIRDCVIKSGSVIDGDGAVGGILSLSRSSGIDGAVTIEGCVVEPGVRIRATDGDGNVQALGGIVAYGMGNVEDCINGAELRAEYIKGGIVGGISGRVNSIGDSSILRCVNTGDIITSGGTIGGIAGTHSDRQVGIKYCYSTGNIRATGSVTYMGGIGGEVSSISDCYWYGEFLSVTGGMDNIGAITGYTSGSLKVENCYYGVKATGSYESKLTTSDKYDGKGSTRLTAEDFEIGRAAYLIDGGDKAHDNNWTQNFGEGLPVLGTPSVYMITIKGSTGPGYIEINSQNDILFWGNGNTVTIDSFPDESTETHEYKLDKILVYDADGNQVDCSAEELEFKMPAKNVTVEAEFTAVEKPVIPPEEPEEPNPPDKPDKPDKTDSNNDGIPTPAPPEDKEAVEGGTDDGDGTGDGTGAGIGEGTGGGTDANGDGNQGIISDQGTGAPVKDSNKSKIDSSAVKSPEQPENKEAAASETKSAEDSEEKQTPPEPEEEEPDKEEESDVFKTLQDNIKENPNVVLLVVVAILLANIIFAFIRFKKLKK